VLLRTIKVVLLGQHRISHPQTEPVPQSAEQGVSTFTNGTKEAA